MTEPADGDPSTPRPPTLVTIHSQTVDRRTVLELSSLAAVISLAGCGVGPGAKTKRIRLGAAAAGWTGRQPVSRESRIRRRN